MKRNLSFWKALTGAVVLGGFLFNGGSRPVLSYAQMKEEVDTKTETEVFIYKGDLMVVKVYSLTRIAVVNPEIVDIANADVNEILLVGQTLGSTPIYIWDELGKRQILATVLKEDLDVLISKLKRMMEVTNITEVSLEKNNYEGKVVASGMIPERKKSAWDEIVARYSDSLINLTTEEKREDLIQIDVQITELSTTLAKEYGFDWVSGSDSGLAITYPETLPTFSGDYPADWYRLGDFNRVSELALTVSMLEAEGRARSISRPSLVVQSGQSASVQVGGQIPTRTTTTAVGGGSVQENVAYQSYGVSFTAVPTIKDGNKIDLTISVTVSDIDASNAVGDDVAFVSRSTNTKVLLDDRQTIVIAGLIKQNRSESLKKIPFLGSIPIIGALFRNRSTPSADLDQELVIIITPTIIQRGEENPFKKKDVAASVVPQPAAEPAPATLSPGEEDRFLEVKPDVVTDAVAEGEDLSPEMGEENLSLKDAVKPAEAPAFDKKPAAVLPSSVEAPAAGDSSADDMAVEQEEWMVEAPGQDPAGQKAVTDYVKSVQKKISESISFPYEAKEKGWEGTVHLTMTLLSDGTLQDVDVKQSSGHMIFDNDAKNTAQILAPFDPFPAEMDLEEIVVTVPIVYSQNAMLDQMEESPLEE
ncbi:MAG: TonB family protein [Candidatus Omnitrophota bacterium]|nr:TonB family protein [Candidatus Omnitrophota bacterium]MDZ4241211.1 TonB family protein [Candidatus Omnitrophota bacterium]